MEGQIVIQNNEEQWISDWIFGEFYDNENRTSIFIVLTWWHHFWQVTLSINVIINDVNKVGMDWRCQHNEIKFGKINKYFNG